MYVVLCKIRKKSILGCYIFFIAWEASESCGLLVGWDRDGVAGFRRQGGCVTDPCVRAVVFPKHFGKMSGPSPLELSPVENFWDGCGAG